MTKSFSKMKSPIMLFLIAMCGFSSATSIITPRIEVDPKSAVGLTDNANVRCTVIGEGADNSVVVDLRTKKGFIDIGVNITVGDESGDLLSALISPQPSGEWMAYRFTIRKVLLDSVRIELYRSKHSFNMNLRGLPVRSRNNAGEKAGTGQPASCPESKPEGNQKPQPKSEGRSR
jgi:hypothetical protein